MSKKRIHCHYTSLLCSNDLLFLIPFFVAVLNKPPFRIKEQGYASFEIVVEMFFKGLQESDQARKASFKYYLLVYPGKSPHHHLLLLSMSSLILHAFIQPPTQLVRETNVVCDCFTQTMAASLLKHFYISCKNKVCLHHPLKHLCGDAMVFRHVMVRGMKRHNYHYRGIKLL